MASLQSDSELIRASLGEPDCFALVFDRHFSAVFRFVGASVWRDHVADISSEVFVRAFEQRSRYNPEYRSARPWLLGIAANLVADHYRKQAREDRAYRRASATAASSQDFENSASDRVDAETSAPMLRKALHRLRPEDVSIVVLFAVDQMTYREIASALGIPEGTVRSRLSRARVRLRNFIETSGEFRLDETNE